MNYHSDEISDEAVAVLLAFVDKFSRRSEADGCTVVHIMCWQCGRVYGEEVGVAKAKIISQAPFVCIDCDVDAGVSSGSIVAIPPCWFV